MAPRLLPLAALLLAAGCQGAGDVGRAVTAPFRSDPAPAWVNDPPRRDGWLFAAGSAPRGQRDAALAQAQRELASQIQVSIAVDDRRVDTGTLQEATGQARVERFESAARNEVRLKAQARDLPGVRVEKEEEGGDKVYVLLALDRGLWAADLRGRLAALDERLVAEVKAREDDSRPAVAAQLLHLVVPLLAERDDLVTRLRAAAPGVQPPKDPVDRVALRARLDRMLAAITVELPAGPEFHDMLPQLTDSFAAVGLRTAAPGEQAVLRLKLAIKAQVLRIDNQYRVDAQVSGGIEDAAKGRRLGGIQVGERAGAPSEAEARDRLALKLAKRLADELDKRLIDMLHGL